MRHPSPMIRLAIALAIAVPAAACGGGKGSGTGTATGPTADPSPTPMQVCEHLADLIARENGGPIDPSVRGGMVRDCEVEMQKEANLRGPQGWDGVSRCVLAARNADDIDTCDRRFPAPADAPPVGSREERACEHIITVIAREDGATVDAATRAELHRECVGAFHEDRETMTGARYDTLVNCILSAQSVAALEACGKT